MSLVGRFNLIPFAVLVLGLLVTSSLGQEADARFPGTQKNDPDQPVGIRETREKMRIDQEKKDYQEMLDRGEQALKLSQDLEKAFEQRPSITRADIEKLDDLEKLVKKVRGEMGGNSDDNDDQADELPTKTVEDGIKALPVYAGKLVEELKKTSRFGISAAAIQSSNSVLRIVRFLKGSM
jgi:hypothetical protein